MNQTCSHGHRPPRAPLDPHEYMRQRRERRLNRNTSAAQQAKIWADQKGFTCRIHNDGHHWIWQKAGLVAEWWPSSAKLVLNRKYDRSFQVHDWTGVIPFLESEAGASSNSAALGRQTGTSIFGP